jgi:hypothetical protein
VSGQIIERTQSMAKNVWQKMKPIFRHPSFAMILSAVA